MRHPPAALLALSAAALGVICLSPSAFTQSYYDLPTPHEIEADEHEALIMALDALGLSLDDHELQDLDNGELWAVIDAHARKEKSRDGQSDPTENR